ncbi:Gfo/Idh/MocA family oxidoreductase [Anoxybacillus flavithermus]|uniref:Glycerol-3-phosphate cytidylyltransferase n=1 Tax=Anoxybacillus flavithermus TaxID=33934 RepID=A0AAX2A5H0_9BACL|nr:Gfo/Idh/MocA family oxidoreductase [Anoxybacillus flavithermus]MBE2920986.1 Gfo/Idh/MocA family oxidoreductase [Anoxybacillus flavithermus]RWU15149.1 glycerol-3-phosphate cytidylyltransferase [Anoxybacillus flavithermus]
MKKVITYGTFDLFHEGHYRLLKRAKELGDYLIVGVTTDNYDKSRGKLNVQQNLMERIENVRKCGLADEIIIEEYEGQKIEDIQKYNVDVFAIGSDWMGQFDYLKSYCDVVYLERTRGISSTELRNKHNGIIRLGMVGNGRIARRFVTESKYVSGVNIEGVFGRNPDSLEKFTNENELEFFSVDYSEFLGKVDAVYIATPHQTHYQYIKDAILQGKHVLCEKPMVLSGKQAEELYSLAKDNNCVLLEAIKTAYCPGFIRLVSLVKSGIIGEIKSVDATFTKLVEGELRELDTSQAGGSMTELGSYPLLAFTKLLGGNIKELRFYSYFDKEKNVDLFTKFNLLYPGAIATGKVGLGVKSEGDLIISGTKGYIYVPSPWWKTEYFEVRYEDSNMNKKYYYKFEGDGLRYELAEFLSLINKQDLQSYKLKEEESIQIIRIIEKFMSRENVVYL